MTSLTSPPSLPQVNVSLSVPAIISTPPPSPLAKYRQIGSESTRRWNIVIEEKSVNSSLGWLTLLVGLFPLGYYEKSKTALGRGEFYSLLAFFGLSSADGWYIQRISEMDSISFQLFIHLFQSSGRIKNNGERFIMWIPTKPGESKFPAFSVSVGFF